MEKENNCKEIYLKCKELIKQSDYSSYPKLQ